MGTKDKERIDNLRNLGSLRSANKSNTKHPKPLKLPKQQHPPFPSPTPKSLVRGAGKLGLYMKNAVDGQYSTYVPLTAFLLLAAANAALSWEIN